MYDMKLEDYMKVLKLGLESYNEEYCKWLETKDSVNVPFMCFHIEKLDITEEEKIATKWFIKENFLIQPFSPGVAQLRAYMTLGHSLVMEWNLVNDPDTKVRASRTFYIHVLALYNMYDEVPPMEYIVTQMKKSYSEWFTR